MLVSFNPINAYLSIMHYMCIFSAQRTHQFCTTPRILPTQAAQAATFGVSYTACTIILSARPAILGGNGGQGPGEMPGAG